MKVNAVTVTYGDRFHLLDQVIDSLVRERVDKIWVVDNDSGLKSKQSLQLKAINFPQIEIISFSENLGSAGAYYYVLEQAYKEEADQFFWLLDDDNVAQPGALSALLTSFDLLKSGLDIPVLYSYRGHSGKEDQKAVRTGLIKGPRANTFCGFEIRDLFRRKRSKNPEQLASGQVNYPVISVRWGPYGGMFTTLGNFKKIGLPKKELVVYADDQEFSFRFSQLSIPQYLIYYSKVKDIDLSVGEGGGYFGAKTSLFKIFYGLRNTAYLSKKMAENPLAYFLNKWVFILIMVVLSVKYYLKSPVLVRVRLPWIWRAFRDGERGELGKVDLPLADS